MAYNSPLGVPDGSVRAMIVLTLILSLVVLAIMGIPIPGEIGLGTGLAIREYFQSRADSEDKKI